MRSSPTRFSHHPSRRQSHTHGLLLLAAERTWRRRRRHFMPSRRAKHRAFAVAVDGAFWGLGSAARHHRGGLHACSPYLPAAGNTHHPRLTRRKQAKPRHKQASSLGDGKCFFGV